MIVKSGFNIENTLMILDNYLEKAVHDKTNIVEILDYILAETLRFTISSQLFFLNNVCSP